MKHLLLILLSVSMCNVFAGGDACDASSDPRKDPRNYSSDGWYLGDDYQIRLNELATKVDRSLFPQFKECDRIMQEYPRCVNLQTTRKASYEAYVANEQDDARMRAQSAVGAAQYWGS